MAALFRRMVLGPAIIVVTVALIGAIPAWLLIATLVSPLFPGRLRPLRVLSIALLYLVCESLLLVILFGFWLASGFGRRIRTPYWEGIHYDLAELFLLVFFREARRVLHLKIRTEGETPYPGEPLLICCRHAGPGDSFTLMYALLHWYHREPRVVLRDTLAWDPMIDVMLTRLPARFVNPNPAKGIDLETTIGELARNLDENDAFVIFPEGGNFTPERRAKAIARLRRLGLERMAQRAESMIHVLAPKPGGLIAALDSAPTADVVLVAHTGLDHLLTVADVWRELPMDKLLVMRWWRVPREEIPEGREERIDWLFTWWEQIDDWIEENRPVDLPRRRLLSR